MQHQVAFCTHFTENYLIKAADNAFTVTKLTTVMETLQEMFFFFL